MKKHTQIPFSPSRFPVFYGWIILFAGTLGILMSIPGQTMGVSVFSDNLIRDLEINRNNLSLAYFVGTVGSGLLITRAGKLYDKYGARMMAFIAGFFLGVILLYLTRIDRIALAVDNIVPVTVSTFIMLIFGFWGIRFFGQGLLTMISRNMVMKWFDKRRGFANGIMGIFTSFGFSYAPKLLNHFIERFEWKGAWTILAVILGIGFVVFVLIFYRDNPKDSGCIPDGTKNIRTRPNRPPSLPPVDFTLHQAKQTWAFWILTLATALNALFMSGLVFHVVSVFDNAGMDKATALGIFLPASVLAIALQFAGGWISDYIRLKYLFVLYIISLMISSGALIFLGESKYAYHFLIIGNGISWGMYVLLAAVTWPRFYGLKNLGAISGFSLSWMVIGSALGPYLFSLSFVYTSTYTAVAAMCFVLSLILFSFSFKANNPSLGNSPLIEKQIHLY